MAKNGDNSAVKAFEQAILAIKYRPEVAELFSDVVDLPDGYSFLFLKVLKDDPSIETERLAKIVQGYISPYENSDTNAALAEMRLISDAAAMEFVNAIEAIGDKNLKFIREQIKAEFCSLESTPKIAPLPPSLTIPQYEKKFGMLAHKIAEKFGVKRVLNGEFLYSWNNNDYDSLSAVFQALDIAMFDGNKLQKEKLKQPLEKLINIASDVIQRNSILYSEHPEIKQQESTILGTNLTSYNSIEDALSILSRPLGNELTARIPTVGYSFIHSDRPNTNRWRRMLDKTVNLVMNDEPEVNIIKAEKFKQYSVSDELSKWAKLLEDGHITYHDFNEVRAKLLKRS